MATYTVKRNDSLWGILQRQLGRAPTTAEIKALAAANGIRVTGSGANMQAMIQPGQTLNLGGSTPKPAAAAAKPAAAAPKPAAPKPPAPKPAQPVTTTPPPSPLDSYLASNPGATRLWQDVLAANPFLQTLGVPAARLKELVATSSGASELMAKLRMEPAVKKRTQAMYRADGSRRFDTEAELFAWEDQVRDVLRRSGVDVDREYAAPETLIGFAENDLSPDEIRDRLQVWKGVKESGQRAREIFYVYAGLNFTDDDLYEALVDRGRGQELQDSVNAGVAAQLSSPNAWEAWIDRARQAGNARVVDILSKAQQQGSTTAAAVQRVINVDPAFANQIMDSLYNGGNPDAGDFLDLTAMLDAYEFMAVGAAADGAGLELPTLERLQQIRAAGIERSQAIDSYQQFGLSKDKLNAAVLRARGQTFTQADFEDATFFGDLEARREMLAGKANMDAAGAQQGQFSFGRGAGGRFVQSGLSTH
jgi:hypothetical protein